MAGQTMAKRRGDKTQRYVFYLGLALAAVAAIIVFVAVSSGGGTGSGNNVPVVVANEAIPAQTRITSDMLKVEFVSLDKVEANAFTSRSQLLDRVVTEDVAAGAQILPPAVSDSAGDSLAFKVEPGMRGISVGVREVVTAGGNLKAGDNVDIVGIFEVADVESANFMLQVLGIEYELTEPPLPATTTTTTAEGETVEDRGNLVLTVTMLQNVKLLALAQTLTEAGAAGNVADDAAEVDSEPTAATATVELTPQQAQDITWADHFGVLRMDARAVGDETIAEVAPTLFWIERTR